jgi:hypothetical protein
MLDYILKNKEWIFSGIGVSTIGLLFLCFKYFFRRNNPPHRQNTLNSTPNPQPGTMVQTGDISQDEVYRIVKELQEMPPLHLDDVRKNYVGLKVDWLTEYSSAQKKNDDFIQVILTLATKSTLRLGVVCEVKLSEYKQFSILKRGAKIRVVGEIAKFKSNYFEISNVRLFFQ